MAQLENLQKCFKTKQKNQEKIINAMDNEIKALEDQVYIIIHTKKNLHPHKERMGTPIHILETIATIFMSKCS